MRICIRSENRLLRPLAAGDGSDLLRRQVGVGRAETRSGNDLLQSSVEDGSWQPFDCHGDREEEEKKM